MKRQIFTLFFAVIACYALMAQKPEGIIKKTTIAPIIDGTVDDVWEKANTYLIDKPYGTEVPTLGESTWKALYNDNGIFVLVTVTDDVFSPLYAGTSPTTYVYDKCEIYFDVNPTLVDGKGPLGDGLGAGNGHYQFAPNPVQDEIDGSAASDGTDNHGQPYGFKVTDPNYTAEYFFPFSFIVDEGGNELDKTAQIGFDITIIDCDVPEGVRQRMVWSNIGGITESWSNMDDCGTVTLEPASTVSVNPAAPVTIQVYPNPAVNEMKINLSSANSMVVIYNSVGRKVEEVFVKGNKTILDVSAYARGMYFVKVNDNTVTKFVK